MQLNEKSRIKQESKESRKNQEIKGSVSNTATSEIKSTRIN